MYNKKSDKTLGLALIKDGKNLYRFQLPQIKNTLISTKNNFLTWFIHLEKFH